LEYALLFQDYILSRLIRHMGLQALDEKKVLALLKAEIGKMVRH